MLGGLTLSYLLVIECDIYCENVSLKLKQVQYGNMKSLVGVVYQRED